MKEVTYGSYNADGSIAEEANRCILSGRPVNAENSIRERVPGTPYFYRILSSQFPRVTDDMRAQWHANRPSLREAGAAVEAPDYGAQSIEELQRLAEARNLVIVGTGREGRVLKSDLVTALTEADHAH